MYLAWNLFVAITPAIALLCYFYEQDRAAHKSYGARLRVFGLGITAGLPAFLIEGWCDRNFFKEQLAHFSTSGIEPMPLCNALIMGFLLSGAIEELIKIHYMAYIKQFMKVVNSRAAVITYTVMLGLGFASGENVLYVLSYYHTDPTIATGRAFMSLPMHTICAVVMGVFIGDAEFDPTLGKMESFLKAWAVATLIHGAYNSALFAGYTASFIFALSLIPLGVAIGVLLFQNSLGDQNHDLQWLRLTAIWPKKTIAIPAISPEESQRVSQLMNKALNPKGVQVEVTAVGNQLTVELRSSRSLPRTLGSMAEQGLRRLAIETIQDVTVVAKQISNDILSWRYQFSLVPAPEPNKPNNVKTPAASLPVLYQPNHRGLSIMAVLCGFLLSHLIVQVSLFLLFYFSFRGSDIPLEDLTLLDFNRFDLLLMQVGISLAGTLLGTWVTARLVGNFELRHALFVGLVVTAHEFLSSPPDGNFPNWFYMTVLLLTVPIALLGGACQKSLKSSRRALG